MSKQYDDSLLRSFLKENGLSINVCTTKPLTEEEQKALNKYFDREQAKRIELWLVVKRIKGLPDDVEIAGVFSTKESAVDACHDENYCMCMFFLDVEEPIETATGKALKTWFWPKAVME